MMGAQVQQRDWHGQLAWSLETPSVRVTFVPTLGAKLAELTDRRADFEWLIGPGGRTFTPVPYGAVFTQQDMSGWDDMFPTIDACTYPGEGPAHGVPLPDHGEVWTQAWTIAEDAPGELMMRVNGVALSYTLERRASFADDATLALDYQLTNTSEFPLVWLWAAHPQFVSTPAMRIILPRTVKQVVNAYQRPHLGGHGERLNWPEAARLDGHTMALDRQIAGDKPGCHKIYTPSEIPVYGVRLHDAQRGVSLTLRWTDPVRYLGVLVDTRMFNPEPILALEPAAAFYDDLGRAAGWGLAPVLSSHATVSWQLTLTFGKDETR